MKKIIPFKKQISFNNPVSEITSISLEHTLTAMNSNLISGDFIVSGEYKMSESSTNTDPFEFFLPCDIELNERYKIDKVQINIDDFYYELINSSILEVNIDVLLDKLEEEEIVLNEIPIKHETLEIFEKDIEERTVQQESKEEVKTEKMEDKNMEEENLAEQVRCVEDEFASSSIFDNFSSTEEYSTYKIYIVREQDTLESILEKYNTTKEELEKYNDLKEISIGDKIIVPYSYETNK